MTIPVKRLQVPTPSINGSKKPHQIAYTDWGDPKNPHVVICVHGLTRNCRDFDYLANALASQCRVICVDVVGRGQSDWLEDAHDYDYYPLYLSDAISLIRHIRSQYPTDIILDWIGISMGGLIGMMLSIQPDIPIPVRKLVMSDIGPLIPKAALLRLADYVGKDPRFNQWSEFEAYMKAISISFGPLREEQWHHMAVHSAREYADGTYGFRYDPRVSISFKGCEIKDVDLWEWWDKVSVPTLILRGSDSDVLTAETAAQMQVRGPRARIVELAGVGHAPMIMDNQQIEIVRSFIVATD